MRVTLKDIAQATGFSMSTISRVMRSDRYTDPDTKEKVLAAAQALNYKPDSAARRLKYGRSFVVGMVVQDITNPFFSHAILGAERVLHQYQGGKYELIIANTAAVSEREAGAITQMLQRQVEGLIVASNQTDESLAAIRRVLKSGVPVVSVDNDLGSGKIDVVGVDSFDGTAVLTRHLIEAGHKRIAIIAGPQTESHARARLEGFKSALKEGGLKVHRPLVREGDWEPSSGYTITAGWIAKSLVPDAILACNNFMGMGALSAIRDANLAVPDDIALATFDDVEFGHLIRPGLTTLKYSWEDIGARAADLLLARLEGKESMSAAQRRVEVPFELLVRESCGAGLRNDVRPQQARR